MPGGAVQYSDSPYTSYIGSGSEDFLSRLFGGHMRSAGPYSDMSTQNFGLPGAEDYSTRARALGPTLYNRMAPQARETGDWGARQRGLSDLLMGQATGQNSLAAEQFRQMTDQGLRQQQALAASGRPGQQALAATQAGRNSANLTQGMAGQAAQAGLAERLGASQALGGVLQGARGQDQSMLLANLQAQLGQGQLNQQGLLDMMQQELAARQSQQLGGMTYEQNRTQRAGQLLQTPSRGEGILGGLGGLAGAIAAMSDRSLKKDVSPGEREADKFISVLKPYEYQYKNPERWGPGTRLGVMAQDLEKSQLGKQAVVNTREGKMVDTAKLASANAAATGRLGERVSALEKTLTKGGPEPDDYHRQLAQIEQMKDLWGPEVTSRNLEGVRRQEMGRRQETANRASGLMDVARRKASGGVSVAVQPELTDPYQRHLEQVEAMKDIWGPDVYRYNLEQVQLEEMNRRRDSALRAALLMDAARRRAAGEVGSPPQTFGR